MKITTRPENCGACPRFEKNEEIINTVKVKVSEIKECFKGNE